MLALLKLSPKSSRERWNIPESSVYKAIAKLKELGLIKIKSGKLVIEWIVKSDSELSAPAKNSQLRQNQSLKSLKNGASDSPLQRQQYQLASLVNQLQEVESKLEEIVAVRSPYSGRVRRVKILGQNERLITAEVTLDIRQRTDS